MHTQLGKLISEKLDELQKRLSCSNYELTHWHEEHQHITQPVMLIFLRTALTYVLDPTLGQLIFISIDGKYKPYITMNGWITIIHRQSQFDGMQFTYPPTENGGILSWVECAIWRKDYKQPISVREYFQDIEHSESIEKEVLIQEHMRVSRQRALSACARLAFGISTPELYGLDSTPQRKQTPSQQTSVDNSVQTYPKEAFHSAASQSAIPREFKTRSSLLRENLLKSPNNAQHLP